MNAEHEHHLGQVVDYITEVVGKKYRKGQKEHGGKLWEKSGLIEEAINEVADLAVYLITLRTQIKQLQKKFDEFIKTPGIADARHKGIVHVICGNNKKVGTMRDKCCHCTPHRDCKFEELN